MGQNSFIQLGYIPGVFGIKGWLKVFSYCRPIEQILDYATWQLRSRDAEVSYSLEQGKPHGPGVIAKLSGIDTRTLAEALVHAEIWVPEAELSTLSADEFYWYQLLGMKVVTVEGQTLGTIKRLLETGANDVLVVKQTAATKEILIPYVRGDVVTHVDLQQKVMTVDWQLNFSE